MSAEGQPIISHLKFKLMCKTLHDLRNTEISKTFSCQLTILYAHDCETELTLCK